jgi:hypothetical protein
VQLVNIGRPVRHAGPASPGAESTGLNTTKPRIPATFSAS